MRGEQRTIGLPLMVGLVALPIVFVWLLLRPGFARSTRLAAFSYPLGPPLLVLLSNVGQVSR